MSYTKTELLSLKDVDQAPQFLNEEGFRTLKGGYLLSNETPREMYRRVAKSAASYYKNAEHWEEKFFDAMWKNWLCPASPILSNLGSKRGLPISCNSIEIADSVDSIFMKNHELAMLSKNGAGVGIYVGNVRARGESISGNGKSEGLIPWLKVLDSTVVSVSQGSTRRGAAAVYLPIDHGDIDEFLNLRRPTGDQNRRCLNLNHGVCITDDWMNSMISGDKAKRAVWSSLLTNRVETGEPYLFFTDTVNRANPECYKDKDLDVKTSNICCLAGDTLVLTDSGYEAIDSLVGKTVKIWDGENWVENNSFEQRGEDSLLRIHIKDGTYVDSNPKHRWFVAENYNHIREGKYKLKLTSEMKEGDFIEYHDVQSHGDGEEKAAYLKGFLLGDGTSVDSRAMLNLHSVKYMCAGSLLESAKELTVEKVNTNAIEDLSFSDEMDNTDKHKGVYGDQKFKRMKGLSVRKSVLYPWVSEVREKGLPVRTLRWSRRTKIEFLAGLFDADATMLKNSSMIQYASVSKVLIGTVQMLLRSLAINSVLDITEREDGNPCYRLSIGSYDSWNLLQEMPVRRIRFDGKKPNRKTTGWRRVEKIEELSGIHPVYCPVLPTTGKFALANGLMTGNTEITLYTDKDHSFVCCLSSLNLVRYDEWKDTDAVEVAVRFLDAVLEEYIQKSEGVSGLEASRASAIKGRAIGIGVLGWHSLLQSRGIPFDSIDSMQLNNEIFRTIRKRSDAETKIMAEELGEPEWCKGHQRRHTHCMAVAPTVSNSTISGGYSAGIEPIAANIFSQKSAKGTFIRKNPALEKLLDIKEKNTPETWKSINEFAGSVQHLSFLSKEEKDIFLTAREINQHAIIKQAAQRQKWIDQGQSVNLFFASNSSPKYIHEVHLAAWQEGLKTLYYCRSEGVLRGDLASRSKDECLACEG